MDKQAFIALVLFIPAVARWGAVATLVVLPVLHHKGMAWTWKSQASIAAIFVSLCPLLAVLMWQPILMWLLPIYVCALLLSGSYFYKIFRGVNGDMLGTIIEGGELWLLLSVWILFSFVMG